MDIQEIRSDMNMTALYFESIEFKRKKQISNGEVRIDITPSYDLDGEVKRVTLLVKAIKGEEFALEVKAVGEFNFTSNLQDVETQNVMLQTNAVAMMFPFVRSMVTQITAQPNMVPIIIPTINTIKMVGANNCTTNK